MRPTLVDMPWAVKTAQVPEHVKSQLGTTSHSAKQGLDIYYASGKVDFNELEKQKIEFVYLKATDGLNYTDPTYQQHVKALEKTQLLSGAYHFFRPADDAVKQAQQFVEQVHLSKHQLPPMLDVEKSGSLSPTEIKKAVKQWLSYVHTALKCKPILYANGYFWSEYLGVEFNQYAFWLADYATTPTLPDGLKNWRIWQYSEKGRIFGVQNTVDLDVLVNNEVHCHV